MSGTSVTTRALHPDTRIFGAEPEGADDAARSLEAGKFLPQTGPDTICDGLVNGVVSEIPVDPALLEAGDHNGSTFYQHQRFLAVVRQGRAVEVSLNDGIWAVRMGQAAQESARLGQAVTF